MTMVMDHGNRQYGGMGYESVYQNHHVQPNPHQFGEGWSAQPASHPPPPSSVYATPVGPGTGNPVPLNQTPKREELPRPQQPQQQQQPPPPSISVSYSNIPVSAPSMVPNGNYSSVPYGGSDLLVLPQDLPRGTLEQTQPSTATTSMNSFQPAAYSPLEYAHSLPHQSPHSQPPHHQHPHPHHPHHPHPDARLHPTSQPSQPPGPAQPGPYGDALDASRGMVALSQDLTPRNIYAPRTARTSAEAYGFPPTHSSASSISSANNYPYYSASVVSVDSSVTDYSSATSEFSDGLASRTLPRPSGLLGTLPPNPQAMMGSFSSKTPANAQKKHKCKVCDKRFTRPSSLQTHMYSHTGEKPYACDFEGCGRHFSVVSNLRRHKKVHKGEKESGTPEEEE